MSDRPPPASRFYAVPLSGRMECPKCGLLIVWGGKRHAGDIRGWNPVSSLLTCAQCHETYQIGILAWPVSKRGGGSGMPIDQITTVRQLAELRQRASGRWARGRAAPAGATMKDRIDRPRTMRVPTDPVNVFVAEGCTCAPLPWREGCAVHGNLGVDREPDPEGRK